MTIVDFCSQLHTLDSIIPSIKDILSAIKYLKDSLNEAAENEDFEIREAIKALDGKSPSKIRHENTENNIKEKTCKNTDKDAKESDINSLLNVKKTIKDDINGKKINTITQKDVDMAKSIGQNEKNMDTNIIHKEDIGKEIQNVDINNNKFKPTLHYDTWKDGHDSDKLNSHSSETFELNPVI